MLSVDVEDRYSAAEVLNHPWVAVSIFLHFICQLKGKVSEMYFKSFGE